jgi:methyl-accepting chemotaxis protein
MLMKNKAFLRQSIAHRVTMVSGGLLFLVLGIITAAMTSMLLDGARERSTAWVDAKVESVAQALDAQDQTSKLLVERFFSVFSDQFGKTFALNEASGKLTQLGIALNDYNNPCDKFTEFTGGAAAVLMKKDGEFIAISSSIKDQTGERSLQLTIGANHPGFAAIQSGNAFVGRANIFGRPYIARMQPALDLQGQVVGVLWVAFDLSEFDRYLQRLIDESKFFDTGGIYVLNQRAAGMGSTVVEIEPSGATIDPSLAASSVERLFAEHKAVGDGQVVNAFTPLLKPGSDDRFAVLRSSKSTGWLVVGEVSSREASRSQWVALAPFLAMLLLSTVALGIGQFLLIRKWVGRPLALVTVALKRVATGDLSVPIVHKGSDEIGELMSGVEVMRMKFVEMFGSLRELVTEISTASSEIATGSQDLSERTETTAARLQETASNMEQISKMVEESSNAVQAADERSVHASLAATRGREAVEQVVSRMDSINSSSCRITEITGTIDGIAFQTNLLALNASVEAARAGESGRGFAVVASEVRSLAHRATTAAKEIKKLLQESAVEVEAGQRLARAANARMQDISASVSDLTGALRTINHSNSAQSDRLRDIGNSVTMLDAMTQQNAALVEQSTAAAISLKDQAANLLQYMGVFKLAEEPNITREHLLPLPAIADGEYASR